MKKLLIFTNQDDIGNFMPKGVGGGIQEFYNIENLEEKGAMALRGNVLKDSFDENDLLFLISDSISKEKFELFLKEIKGKNDQVYVVYHLNDHEGRIKFDTDHILESIAEQYKKQGSHIGNDVYDIFIQKIKDFLKRLSINGTKWQENETPYTQPQVSEIISAIFKDEAEAKLNKVIFDLYKKLEENCKIEDKDARMQAFKALAEERDRSIHEQNN